MSEMPNATRCAPTVESSTTSAVGEGRIPPATASPVRLRRESGRSSSVPWSWCVPSSCSCPCHAGDPRRAARARDVKRASPIAPTSSPEPTVIHGYSCSLANLVRYSTMSPIPTTEAVCITATATPTWTAWIRRPPAPTR